MSTARWGGKEYIIGYLMDREGYTRSKATRLVEVVINVIKMALIKGKNVEIEGLGVLTITKHPEFRRVERNIAGGPTILTINRKKSVALKKHIILEVIDG